MPDARFLLLVPLLVLFACGGGEGDAAVDADAREARKTAGVEEAVPAAQPDADAGETDADAGEANAEASGKDAASDLRSRVETTPPPPKKEDPFFSTATTVEERKENVLAALERAGDDGVVRLDMHDLGGWEFDETKDQPFPDYVLRLEGRTLEVRGFMMPDVDFENITDFYLVRSLWGCCFGAPPRINELFWVELADEEGMDYTYNTLKVRGTFHAVFEMEDGLIDDVYRLTGATYEVMDFEDPLAPAGTDPDTAFDGVIPGLKEF